tara:strand:+ start:3380 stop:4108 length:729 start_codon:yes stop_codon:yes gene_type:complete
MNEEEQVEQSEIVTEGGDPLLVNPDSQERPEWLPEKFKSAEDLASAYGSLESKIGQKEEDLRANFLKEIEEQAYADRPTEIGDYILPEGLDEELAANNELLDWWANTAFENGYGQDEFKKGIEMYMSAINSDVPDFETELKRLGDNANARTEAVSLFANQFFPEEQLGAIERMCETADGVLALETIMESMRDGGPSSSGSSIGQINEAQLQQMMLDDRYHNPSKRDKDFVRQVEQGFKKLYG